LNATEIIKAIEIPECESPWQERLTQTVASETRYSCIYRPPGVGESSKRPLIVWFHPGGEGSADLAGSETGLLTKAQDYDLTADISRPGFVLVSVQGRNLHFPTASPRDGQHHDFYYRDLATPSSNPDIANVDRIIDTLVAEGSVDPTQIYVVGWSNGGFFSQLYAIARHGSQQATPEGNRIAAAVAFAAADPFENISWDLFSDSAVNAGDDCSLNSYPVSGVPILIVHRTADAAVACGNRQAQCFATEPGYDSQQWLESATALGFAVEALLIKGLEVDAASDIDADASSCTDFSNACPAVNCTAAPSAKGCLSLVNHLRWPDGNYNNPPQGLDREMDMLEFLKRHPLP